LNTSAEYNQCESDAHYQIEDILSMHYVRSWIRFV